MLRRVARFFLRPWRGIAALALLTVAPKCIVCVTAYLGLGTLFGLRGPELCGASTGTPFAWTGTLAVCGLIATLGALGCFWIRRRKRRDPGLHAEG